MIPHPHWFRPVPMAFVIHHDPETGQVKGTGTFERCVWCDEEREVPSSGVYLPHAVYEPGQKPHHF